MPDLSLHAIFPTHAQYGFCHIFCCCLFQFGIFLVILSTWLTNNLQQIPNINLSTNPKHWHRLFSCATGGDCRCWRTPSMLVSSSWEAFSCKTVQNKPNGGAPDLLIPTVIRAKKFGTLHHSGVLVEFGAQVTKHGRKRAR